MDNVAHPVQFTQMDQLDHSFQEQLIQCLQLVLEIKLVGLLLHVPLR